MKIFPTVETALITQKGVQPNFRKGIPLILIAILTNYAMIAIIVLVDVTFFLYQEIYFSITDIPKIPRAKYMKLNRHNLAGLTLIQKYNCWYCEYSNSVLAWAKAIANQTEVYSCAIKYGNTYPEQEYQKDFYSEDAFQKKLPKN